MVILHVIALVLALVPMVTQAPNASIALMDSTCLDLNVLVRNIRSFFGGLDQN